MTFETFHPEFLKAVEWGEAERIKWIRAFYEIAPLDHPLRDEAQRILED